MPAVETLPHLAPSDDSVAVEWFVALRGEVAKAPQQLSGWDPATDLTVIARVKASLEMIREECQLGRDAAVGMMLVWRSGGTSIKRSAPPQRIDDSTREYELTVDVDGGLIAAEISLEVVVFLDGDLPQQSALSAHRAGTVLRRLQLAPLVLEGRAGRFPIEWADFTVAPGLHRDAAWFVEWDPGSPEQPVLGGVRLYLNAKHERLVHAVASPDSGADLAILDALRFDVARTLVVGALANPEFGDPADYEIGTVGRAVGTLIRALFQFGPGDVRPRLVDDPARFETELQGRLGLFRRTAG